VSNYPPPQYQQPYPPPYQAAPNSTTAIISLVAGILGLTLFPIIGSIIAVILGHMAKGEIARSNGTIGGDGAATFGLVLGYIGIGLTVVGLCVFGAVIGLPICGAVLAALFSSSNTNSMLLPVLLAA
jgi:hypothetical protein